MIFTPFTPSRSRLSASSLEPPIFVSMFTRVYFKSVVLLLLLTAGSKVFMVLSRTAILDEPSPLLDSVSNRQLVCLAAGLEVAVACLILSGRAKRRSAALAVAFLATCFASYRLVLWAIGFHGYCDCLGNLSDALHLSPDETNWIAGGILVYFLVGTCSILSVGTRWFPKNVRKLLCGPHGLLPT